MSRHRNVRNMDFDDYDDGYDEYPSPSSSYDGSNFGSYPQSPSMASYLYNRQATQQGTGFSPKHSSPLSTGGSPSKGASGDEKARKDSDSEGALLFDMESSGAGKGRSSIPGDGDLVKECSNRVLKIVGIGAFTKKEIEEAVRKHDYDSEAAAEALRQEKASLDLAKKLRSEAAVVPPVVPQTSGGGGIELVAHPDQGKSISKPDISDRPATAPVGAISSAKNTPKSSPRASPTPDSSSRSKKAPPQRSAAATNSLLTSVQSSAGEGKPRISLVVVGHVDAGKSTLMGHMMYLKGKVSQKVMHKYEKETKEKGKGSFHFAWVLDEHEEERSRGVTMDVGVTYFETNQRKVTLLDAPGHKDFVPAMISGAAQADVAILVVDSATGEFEAGFDHDGQTKEHTMLIRSLGITQVAVAVNKLDMAGWSKDRFDEIVGKLRPFLKQTGFKDSNIRYVPVSGLEGENLMKRSNADLNAWYTGPTLHDVIDTFGPSERPLEKPFRLCVADVFKSMSLGLTIGGKIESGLLSPGDKVAIVPGNEVAVVKGVERDGEQVKVAVAGENVEVGLTGLEMFMVGVGNVLCDPENMVPVVTKFEAQIVTFNITMPVVKGAQVVLHTQSINEPAVIKKLIGVMDKSSGEIAKKRPRCLTKNMTAVVEIHVSRPVCLDLYSEIKNLGRFMLREDGRSIAAGIVSKIIK